MIASRVSVYTFSVSLWQHLYLQIMTEVAKESAIAALMSGLSFWQLAILVVVLFTSHNYMQELLMSFPCFGSVRIVHT